MIKYFLLFSNFTHFGILSLKNKTQNLRLLIDHETFQHSDSNIFFNRAIC
jgi:hypothetical protein